MTLIEILVFCGIAVLFVAGARTEDRALKLFILVGLPVLAGTHALYKATQAPREHANFDEFSERHVGEGRVRISRLGKRWLPSRSDTTPIGLHRVWLVRDSNLILVLTPDADCAADLQDPDGLADSVQCFPLSGWARREPNGSVFLYERQNRAFGLFQITIFTLFAILLVIYLVGHEPPPRLRGVAELREWLES